MSDDALTTEEVAAVKWAIRWLAGMVYEAETDDASDDDDEIVDTADYLEAREAIDALRHALARLDVLESEVSKWRRSNPIWQVPRHNIGGTGGPSEWIPVPVTRTRGDT